jgi:chromosome segregation protein
LADAQAAVAALPSSAATEAELARLRQRAEIAQRALADVRAEAATHARAISADRQRAEAARKERADWKVRAAEAAKRHSDLCRRIREADEEAERLADAPERLSEQVLRFEREWSEAQIGAERLLRLSGKRRHRSALRKRGLPRQPRHWPLREKRAQAQSRGTRTRKAAGSRWDGLRVSASNALLRCCRSASVSRKRRSSLRLRNRPVWNV